MEWGGSSSIVKLYKKFNSWSRGTQVHRYTPYFIYFLNYIKSLKVGVGGYTGTQVHTLLHLFFKVYKKFNSRSRGVHRYTGTHPTSSIF